MHGTRKALSTAGHGFAQPIHLRLVDTAPRADVSVSFAKPRSDVQPASRRVVSVDVLRGFVMFWILGGDALTWSLGKMLAHQGPLVSGAAQALSDQFGHVAWEGFRFYDLIFALFIFIVGTTTVFSLTSIVRREGRRAAVLRIVRRALLLYALGLIYYGGLSHHWPDIRLLGVLQRIAICYLFAALLFVAVPVRGLVVAFLAILVGYWALMTFVPVPGVGAGSYAEGANLANWIDAQYLPGLKWNGTWDPEGLLSTIPAIGTCLLGVFAGLLLQDVRLTPQQKSGWLVGAGAVLAVLGAAWGLQFPVIKNIWTSSFVLVAGGWSLILLGVAHQLVDVWKKQSWATVFVWIGANAITLYVLNTVMSFYALAMRLVGGDVASFLDRHVADGTGGFVATAVSLALVVALARFLYQRKIFLRV